MYSSIHVYEIFISLLPLVLPTDTHITTMTQNELFTAHDIHNNDLYPTRVLQNYRENTHPKPLTQIFYAQYNSFLNFCFLLFAFLYIL
jgi:hypothetical protein